MATSSAPIEIGRVALTVNDIQSVGRFYETVLGLEPMRSDAATAAYGAGGKVLLELRSDPTARRRSPREAGLFHTAFLLPERADLGRWLHFASEARQPIVGASDHGVSEALYLNDPEGNGIEIYIDRPRDQWIRNGDAVEMVSDPLDLEAIAATATTLWRGAPAGTVVGHVHLQVGSIPEAEAFYGQNLGLTLTCRYPGGSFYGAGGYHHHIATNVWNSRGAGPRSYPSTGLADVELLADAANLARLGTATLTDPWGTTLSLTAKDA